MVLEAAVNSFDGTGGDSAPNDDLDAYPSTYSSHPTGSDPTASYPAGYVVDGSKLPSPLPLFGVLQGMSDKRLKEMTYHQFRNVAAVAKRPLSKDECDLLAYQVYKANAIASWGSPLGGIAGLYRFQTTRKELRFPFYKPGPTFNKEKLVFLTGARAVRGWQLLSLAAYSTLGSFLGKQVAAAYATTVVLVSANMDPRFADIRAIMTRAGEESRGRGRQEARAPRGDGAGPRDGQMVEDYGGVAPEAGGQGGAYTDPEATSAVRTQRWQPPPARDRGRPTTPATAAREDTQSPVFDFDDASPTAGAGMKATSNSTSAWDRLRSENASAQKDGGASPRQTSGAGNAWTNARANSSSSSGAQQSRGGDAADADPFGFSSTDADRQQTKERAQREFDESLDRERRGGNFDDGKRWR